MSGLSKDFPIGSQKVLAARPRMKADRHLPIDLAMPSDEEAFRVEAEAEAAEETWVKISIFQNS
jgi:hypothetical protein